MDSRIINGKFIRLPANLKEEWRKQFDNCRQEYETANLG